MLNPYRILGLPQNADKLAIHKAKIEAMRVKKFSLAEISAAEKQLLDPSRRLAADFLFPSKIKAKRIQKLDIPEEGNTIGDLNKKLNPDAMDSL